MDLHSGLDRLSTTLPNLSIHWLDAEEVLALHHRPDVDQIALRYDLLIDKV